MHNAVYNLYTVMGEAPPFTCNFEEIEEEPAQAAVYNAPPCICDIQGSASVVTQWCNGSFCCSRQRTTHDSGE